MRGKKGCSTKGPIKAGFPEWRQSDMFLNSGAGGGGLPGHSFEWVGICHLLSLRCAVEFKVVWVTAAYVFFLSLFCYGPNLMNLVNVHVDRQAVKSAVLIIGGCGWQSVSLKATHEKRWNSFRKILKCFYFDFHVAFFGIRIFKGKKNAFLPLKFTHEEKFFVFV